MPRILFSLAAEIHKPLAIPGSPDIAGELTLEAPSDTIRTGTGPAWVSGWASTSVHPDRLDLPRTRVEFVGRKCVVPISTSKAEGTVTVHAWEWFEKADAAANLRALSGLLSGRDIEATGTLGAVKADRWEPPAQPDAPPPVKPPVINWRDRLGRPMLWMGAPQYPWALLPLPEVNAVLDAIAAAGLDGPSIEFGGTFIRDEYNKIPNRDDIADIYDRQADAWGPWETGIRARGQVAHIAYLNANQSKANRMSDQLWEAKARAFIRRYGPDNKLGLPLSESDTRTRAGIGDAIARGLVAGGLPRSQIISMAGKWGDWREVHHGRGKVPSGDRRTICVNDNGPSIADLYGSRWQQGGTPNLPHIEEYAAEIRRKGVSGAIYSFGTAFDFAGCAAAGKGWGGQATPEQPGTGIAFRGDHPRRRYVSWTGVSRKGWKTKPVSGETINGALWLNGRFCEHIPEGRDNTGISNALTRGKGGVNARKGYYQPGLRKGQVVPVEVRRIDNKPTGYAGTVTMSEDAEK